MKITSFLFIGVLLAGTTSLLASDLSALLPKAALDAITAGDLLKVLTSEEFEGRAPGSKGEDLSVKYISEQFKSLGLKPGNPNGSYTQEVPLAGIKSAPIAAFAVKGKTTNLRFPDDYVASSTRHQPQVDVKIPSPIGMQSSAPASPPVQCNFCTNHIPSADQRKRAHAACGDRSDASLFVMTALSVFCHARFLSPQLILLTRALPLSRPLGLPIYVAASQLAPLTHSLPLVHTSC